MAKTTRKRHINDLEELLSYTMVDSGGDAVNLSGTTVYFRMTDVRGNDVVEETNTGVSIADAASGTVTYQFSSGGVDEAGVYYGYFTAVYDDNSNRNTSPQITGELVILIMGD